MRKRITDILGFHIKYKKEICIVQKKECNHSYQGCVVDGRILTDPFCQKCGAEKE